MGYKAHYNNLIDADFQYVHHHRERKMFASKGYILFTLQTDDNGMVFQKVIFIKSGDNRMSEKAKDQNVEQNELIIVNNNCEHVHIEITRKL